MRDGNQSKRTLQIAAEQICDRFQIPVVYLTAYADDKTLEGTKTPATVSAAANASKALP